MNHDSEMPSTFFTSILFGRGWNSLKWVFLATIGLSLVSFVGVSFVRRLAPELTPRLIEVFYPLFLLNSRPVAGVGVVIGWVILSGAIGYRQEGLLASWTISFGPLFGGLTNSFVARNLCCAGATTSPTTLTTTYSLYSYGMNTLLAVIAALSFALVFGTAGYLFAIGTKLLLRPVRSNEEGDTESDDY
ncbi:hypothetical protein [Halorussus amylolyticus]|uniref:hypothetical protein n=1 Tax=Halorussus amylolyticus TaxID=1126242 RepID=UPI001051EF84|nr:hypothetical protein [Halorussus amylolyticus]